MRCWISVVSVLLFVFVAASAPGKAEAGDGYSRVCASAVMPLVGPILNRTFEERILVSESRPLRQALFVFPAKYPVLLETLLEVIEARFGINERTEIASSNLEDLWLQESGGNDPSDFQLAKKSASRKRLKAGPALAVRGIDIEGFAETRIVTERYNEMPDRNGWSQSTIRIIDGAEMLGLDSTVVIVDRIDRAEEWGIHSIHDPFSFGYEFRTHQTVTTTEYAVMRDVAETLSVPFIVLKLGDAFPLYGYVESWIAAKEWLADFDPSQPTKPHSLPSC